MRAPELRREAAGCHESAPAAVPNANAHEREACLRIGRLAVRSLHAELILYPKPGLVSLIDSGSHDDMDALTFMRSLFALRSYFVRMAQAGIDGAPFTSLRRYGVEAEQRMLAATGGVNTHRGAIFSLGLLCAAAGRCHAQQGSLSSGSIRSALLEAWGKELAAHQRSPISTLSVLPAFPELPETSISHGLKAAAEHGAGGAREEAALGFPSIFEVALPRLRQSLAQGRSMQEACIDALFSLMAHIGDTNVLHRGGAQGAAMLRRHARRFLALGGTAHAQWKETALRSHRLFIRHRLSPGGAADLLAATWFIHHLAQPESCVAPHCQASASSTK